MIRAEPKTVMAGPTKCSRRIPRNISVAIRCKIAKLRSLLRGLAKNSVSSESSLPWRGVGLGTVSTYGDGTLTSMAVSVKHVMVGLAAACTALLASCASDDTMPDAGTETSDQVVDCPAVDPQDLAAGITQERANLLLGFSEADAERCAGELGWAFRVGIRDGEALALTMDYSAQRVTVEVQDDRVEGIAVG